MYFVGGDLNAHHKAWDNKENCRNGNIIFEYTDPEYFFLLNDKSVTCCSGAKMVKSSIDLSFTLFLCIFYFRFVSKVSFRMSIGSRKR